MTGASGSAVSIDWITTSSRAADWTAAMPHPAGTPERGAEARCQGASGHHKRGYREAGASATRGRLVSPSQARRQAGSGAGAGAAIRARTSGQKVAQAASGGRRP